jgi:peptide/nickel transport system permease protein
VVTFVLLYVIPHDPARTIAGSRASPEDVARIRTALGLDRPFVEQLIDYVGRAVRGDFGYSFQLRTPVLPLLMERFPATLQLALAGLGLSLAIGLPLGVIAARNRRGVADRLGSGVAVLLVSIPAFWLGYLLLHFLAYQPAIRWGIDLFPLSGYEPFSIRHLALPALTLGLTGAAYYSRLTRSGMVSELSADYVRTAEAKGMPGRVVTWRHAFRNALPPVIALLGLDLGFLLGGVVIIEQVFGWPGIGKLAADALFRADIPLVMGTVLFGTVCIVIANLVVDVVNALLDPRIRR